MEYFLHVSRFTVNVATCVGILEFCVGITSIFASKILQSDSRIGAVFLPVPLSFPPGFLFLFQLELSWETYKLKKKKVSIYV